MAAAGGHHSLREGGGAYFGEGPGHRLGLCIQGSDQAVSGHESGLRRGLLRAGTGTRDGNAKGDKERGGKCDRQGQVKAAVSEASYPAMRVGVSLRLSVARMGRRGASIRHNHLVLS